MKTIRIFAFLLVAVMLFTVSAMATQLVPSIEAKNDPKLEGYEIPDGHEDHGEELIITPLDHFFDDDIELHDDIEESLKEAYEDLKDELLHHLVENFDEHWDRITGGAPIEQAIVTHLFDVRFRCELGQGGHQGATTVRANTDTGVKLLNATVGGVTYNFVDENGNGTYNLDVLEALTAAAAVEGVEITFQVEILGLGSEDEFFVVYRCSEQEHWKDIKEDHYKMVDTNILEITGKTMAAYAIVEDSGKAPEPGPGDPDSPQTNVPAYFFPAVIGTVLFAGAAIVCVRKATKKNAA